MFFLFNFKPYIAIIGDIKDSRKIPDRLTVQEKMGAVLKDINHKYDRDIATDFLITLGDEFQGLLLSGEHIMEILLEIERRMYPVRMRFGIGVGAITTGISRKMAIGSDGPAYYRAREAVEYLKQIEKRNRAEASTRRVASDGDNQASIMLLNTIFTLMKVVEDSWTDRQRMTIEDMLEHRDSQAAAAKRLNITQPTVQKALAKGNYYAYCEALNTVGSVLGEIRQDGF